MNKIHLSMIDMEDYDDGEREVSVKDGVCSRHVVQPHEKQRRFSKKINENTKGKDDDYSK